MNGLLFGLDAKGRPHGERPQCGIEGVADRDVRDAGRAAAARSINRDDDGFAFFAQHRLLRWLDEPRVRAALDARDRAALDRPRRNGSSRSMPS
jgi:hypothetical protein